MSNISISIADFSALVIELEKLREEVKRLKSSSVSDCNDLANRLSKAEARVEAWEQFWDEARCHIEEDSKKALSYFVKEQQPEISKNISPRLL